MIRVELFGVVRLKAGVREVALRGATLGDVLGELADRCPALVGPVLDAANRLHPAYRVSLDGRRFLDDPAEPLSDGACLLILAADVGG